MAQTWNEQLASELLKRFGNKKGEALNKRYAHAFSHGYSDEYTTTTAIDDILHIEKLSIQNPIEINFYSLADQHETSLHIRLFQWEEPASLSDILPMLENLNLRTNNDTSHKINLDNHNYVWISDFSVTYEQSAIEIDKVKDLFEQAFLKIYFNFAENDGFNKLILSAELGWREILILRAYAKYLRQTGFRFSQTYIENALVNNALVARDMVTLFETLHDPAKQSKAKAQSSSIEQRIAETLNNITSLDEDRIIRRMLDLIKATLRTNYFQTDTDGNTKDYISLKLSSRLIPELPLPVPLYEIFVYSPRFEAVHLRNTKVARGGIRWSDRREDFRTEILGLMKAQTVKNSIIIPSGAKGGFVLKTRAVLTDRNALQEEVIFCYQSFINGMLDITDNIVDNQFVRPKQVVCYDDNDPYLVVAADKGTASFSDIANAISKEHNFWLGDAFASGGKTGYDHKKMGITARGAWESIKRHFRELHVDVLKTSVTVIGIGDMSGDVFGNGMLYSQLIKLVGAFDHRHIFIDPDSDPEIAYYERLRLFNLPQSSWEDYNAALISKGGGVFKRNLKSITLTPQMKQLFAVQDDVLTPNELIRAMLKAPVDLLYNGGIGTYVKASTESQADVGDRTNDYCRVNGSELRTKVVGEGGNLGFTQLGRIEYALTGGLINTDFIDNSGGVDCSDHEVNLKILLDSEVKQEKLSYKKRNELLVSVTQEVADLVLHDNYNQALIMSYSAYRAKKNIGLHQEYITELVSQGVLNRQVEFLPDDKEIAARKAEGLGLTRPELAILLAYTKINVKHEILKTSLPEDTYLSGALDTAFPISLRKKYHDAMKKHRLHRDIIATQLSNHLVNEMGITFIYRLQIETGATLEEIVRSYIIASNIFGSKELSHSIESLDFKIPMTMQYEMLYNIRNLINLGTRWFLRSNLIKDDLHEVIHHFASGVTEIKDLIPELMAGVTKDYLTSLNEEFSKLGLPKELARTIATYRAIYTSLNIIDVATQHQLDLSRTAKVYFAAGEHINLVWFRDQLANDTREGHWNTLARLTLRDELDAAQRALTVAIMKDNRNEASTVKLIEKWSGNNKRALERWNRILTMLLSSTNIEYTMFFITLRELLGLIMQNRAG